jgi:NADH:ubiquinone oxidoreductase subunit H
MHTLTAYIIPVALAAVAMVLIAGMWNMMRGGSPNLSQTLMRWRVILQFIALCLVMAASYFSGRT